VILVSGLPSSGNRLIAEHIKRGVAAARSEEFVQIWHGDNEAPNVTRPEGERLAVVMPVRGESFRLRSVDERLRRGEGVLPSDVAQMRANLVRFLSWNDCPVYVLSLEGLAQSPEAEGRLLFTYLRLPWVPWPAAFSSDPRRPELGRVYDPNRRYGPVQ
jgi:hypothetical protein